jgi:hypothetical protein
MGYEGVCSIACKFPVYFMASEIPSTSPLFGFWLKYIVLKFLNLNITYRPN